MLILLGFGGTNRAIAEKFAPCIVLDDSFEQESKDSLGNSLLPSAHIHKVLANNPESLIVTSPGIPPHNAMIQAVYCFMETHKQTLFLSEYDFFAFHSKMPPSVWISGTNGKTTTTQILTHLLQSRGAQSGGNIGTPLAKLDPKSPLWILETSSFTLHYTQIAKPILYLLLPITQDHISWHESYANYISDKLKPILSLREKEVAILPKNLESHEFVQQSRANLIFYQDSKDLAEIFHLDLDSIRFKEPFLLDAALAMSACEILFSTQDYALLNAFKIGAHKIEEFYDKCGNLWVDDSKGTNLDATMEAIKCYQNSQILLILGGDDKGADLTPLFEWIAQCKVEIFAIGSNTDKLCNLAKTSNTPCNACYTLEVAVKKIQEVFANKNPLDSKVQSSQTSQDSTNTIALLSPAAASLDQFSSYKERGEKFKAYVLRDS
ncbi:MAG: UDP-N-acetylmuramoyl-L-alanine--D-glutamate ligase [Lachnospiraceae bacterium]|nr:UDP-N-acetylmuramoyl-L-alanine--D-glutamate ligase [Lachnospiraceae bacterium]